MNDVKHFEFYYKLRTLPFVEEIWLFGSRSKREERERSDIDLAILCPSASPQDWQKVREVIDNADTLLTIDCIRFDQLTDDRLKSEIENSKTVLLKRIQTKYIWYETFLDLGGALDEFSNVILYDRNQMPFIVEATIHVFEYTFELYWKLLKKICYEEGVDVNSPRATLQQAYVLKLIDDEQIWLEIMENRNLTSHTYRQTLANQIYGNCKKYVPVMIDTYAKLKERYKL